MQEVFVQQHFKGRFLKSTVNEGNVWKLCWLLKKAWVICVMRSKA